MAGNDKKTVAGTKLRGATFHLNLRIPVEAQPAFGGKSHLRGSLRTSDPKTAREAVTKARAKIIEAVEQARQRDTLSEAVTALPPEQRELYEEAGGLEGLLQQYAASEKARAFLIAGGAVTESELQGRVPSSGERLVAEAVHKAELAAIDQTAQAEAKLLHTLGQDVETVDGLRELLAAYVKAKGTGDQTADAMGGIVGRFIELHGDLPLSDLTIAHLREYSGAIEHLPAITSSKRLRGQKLPVLIKIAQAEGLQPVSVKTRAKHISMLKALTAFAPGQGYMDSDPWAAFKFIAPKVKHSAQKPRAPFTGDQVAQVLAMASKADPATIDHWAPLLATYQGARREEIGQLMAADVFEDDGVWVMRITDEGEGQKVKNAASFRTIPLHQALIEAGFHIFAAGRPNGEYLFREAKRWGGKLSPMRADARGRLTEPFGKRFSRMLREKLAPCYNRGAQQELFSSAFLPPSGGWFSAYGAAKHPSTFPMPKKDVAITWLKPTNSV